MFSTILIMLYNNTLMVLYVKLQKGGANQVPANHQQDSSGSGRS